MTKPTVLLAEDEDMVRHMLEELLRQEQCDVLSARDGISALQISRQHPGRIHLLITDLLMPGMSGIELLRQIQLERPDTGILIISGRGSGELIPAGVELLRKPFPTSAFRLKLRQLLPEKGDRRI